MKTARYDEPEVTQSLYRLGPSGSLLLFFAFASAMSHDEWTQMAAVTPAAPPPGNEANDALGELNAPGELGRRHTDTMKGHM